jgi:outer membrane protein assembly factor BamE (lipoprotein component of BamABCDE complex)
MKRLALAVPVLALLLLPACANTGGKEFNAANSQRIRSGATDKATVRQLLGEPLERSVAPDGRETWSYAYTMPRPNAQDSGFPDPVTFYTALFGTLPSSRETREVAVVFEGETVARCELLATSTPVDVTDASAWGSRSVRGATQRPGNSARTTCGDLPVAVAEAKRTAVR